MPGHIRPRAPAIQGGPVGAWRRRGPPGARPLRIRCGPLDGFGAGARRIPRGPAPEETLQGEDPRAGVLAAAAPATPDAQFSAASVTTLVVAPSGSSLITGSDPPASSVSTVRW